MHKCRFTCGCTQICLGMRLGANQAIIFATAHVEILNILWTVHISEMATALSL